MSILVRRSNLMVPVTNDRFVRGAWRHGSDAITLDLEDGVASALKAGARQLVEKAVATVGKGAAEVFVRINKEYLVADLEASVWPGLAGIMLPKVESPEDVLEASDVLSSAERRRGIEPGTLSLILLLESANAVFRVREIIAASARVSQVGLDESDLSASLGLSPLAEYDPFVYARGRLGHRGHRPGCTAGWRSPPSGHAAGPYDG